MHYSNKEPQSIEASLCAGDLKRGAAIVSVYVTQPHLPQFEMSRNSKGQLRNPTKSDTLRI